METLFQSGTNSANVNTAILLIESNRELYNTYKNIFKVWDECAYDKLPPHVVDWLIMKLTKPEHNNLKFNKEETKELRSRIQQYFQDYKKDNF